MKKSIFIAILILGIFLRLNQLGGVPQSLDWDEVSLGYNAYSMWLKGEDEYGNSWPLSIRSFNDYKPPMYAYLTIPSVAIFGLTEFAVRLPSAIMGSLTLPFVYLLAAQFTRRLRLKYAEHIPMVSMFLFAISPWSLQFSRAAFEANVALFFVVSGMYFLLKFMDTSKKVFMGIATILLAASLYSYHAPRLVVPLLLVGILIKYRSFAARNIKAILIASLIGLIFIAPLALVLMRGGVSSRFTSVSIFKPTIEMLRTLDYAREDEENNRWESILHNRRTIYLSTIIEGYLDHFYPTDMFLKGDPVGRHHAPGVGLFYLIELPLILIGIIVLIKKKFDYKFIFFYWVFLAPIPAAISTGTPHAIRSILFLPLPQIAIATGIVACLSIRKKIYKIAVATAIVLAYCANMTYYFHQYYVQTDMESAIAWQYGYKELIEKLKPIEKNYDKIVITTDWDQPYIYFLFYKKYDPRVWVNNGEFNKGFDKYEFRSIKWQEDRKLPNTLLVGGPREIPENEPGTIDVIKFPDKKLDAFRLYDDFKY